MTQNNVDYSLNPDGEELLDNYLKKEQENILTSNSGIQRPSYAVAGTKWLDVSVTPWLLKIYDGTDDIILGTIDSSTHLFTPNGVLPSQDGQSGKFLQTNGTITSWANSVDYNNITNCITKIPQDIKLEINNDGRLILKSGSVIYNGSGSPININNDYTASCSGTGSMGVFYSTIQNAVYCNQLMSDCTSGTSAPSGTGMFYNTSTKSVGYYNNGVLTEDNWSLPLAIVNVTNGGPSKIEQVFNGFGYIGSTVFVLPGVKGLIPNGRNADGSLNNINVKTETLETLTSSDFSQNGCVILLKSNGVFNYLDPSLISYNNIENRIYQNSIKIEKLPVVLVESEGSKITNIKILNTFQAKNDNFFDDFWYYFANKNLIKNGTIENNTTQTFTLTFLPNNDLYEIKGSVYARTEGTSGSAFSLRISGNPIVYDNTLSTPSNGTFLLSNVNRSTSYVAASGQFTVLVKNKKIAISNSGSKAQAVYFNITAYKKVNGFGITI